MQEQGLSRYSALESVKHKTVVDWTFYVGKDWVENISEKKMQFSVIIVILNNKIMAYFTW